MRSPTRMPGHYQGTGESEPFLESSEEGTVVEERQQSVNPRELHNRLAVETSYDSTSRDFAHLSPSRRREEWNRLEDELEMQRAERIATTSDDPKKPSAEIHRSRSRVEPVDEFDVNTNPIHETTALYKPPERPATKFAKFFKYIHQRSFLVRWVLYITPVSALLLIPLLVGALLPRAQDACVGGVSLLWFSVWLQIVWLTLWGARLAAKMIPYPMGLIASLFTSNAKKWRDLGKALEVPATLFFWGLSVLISFLPTMRSHHCTNVTGNQNWETIVNKIIVAIFVLVTLNFVEKIIIQLIAISFHLRTYADRIEINKFQIGSLVKLYTYSRTKIAMEDAEFELPSGPGSGARTPAIYAEKAQRVARDAIAKFGDAAGTVAKDFTGKNVKKSSDPHQVILTLLNTTNGSQVLARRLYRTFVRKYADEYAETISSDDLKAAFDREDEAEAAFTMFDKDLNGDISMQELEAVCVEIGRERKSITASLKDLDSVVGKLDNVLAFFVLVVSILVLISLISTSAAGVLTSAGSAVLALSWLFQATAQEFLQSVVFVFVKHPFDVGDRVSIYGNTGSTLKGYDYFVKEISLLYTEFKKMEGHIVQAPNSYLNTLFILNQRRSGGLAEAVPVTVGFGTTLDQITELREQLLLFVQAEKREYQSQILTELRDVTECYSINLNVVFFYKSNWQNEGLRLSRRNKFISALMTTIQSVGIEGPYRNLPGGRPRNPYFMQPGLGLDFNKTSDPWQQSPTIDGPDDSDQTPSVRPPPSSISAVTNHPSILRHRAPSNSRGRSESVSQMAKRVDFSLGMENMTSGDMMSDAFEGRREPRVTEAIRESNREDARRASTIAEEQENEQGDEHHAHMAGGLRRRSTTRSSLSQGGHRGRFLPRFGRAEEPVDITDDVEMGGISARH